jgi:hypothetical protein
MNRAPRSGSGDHQCNGEARPYRGNNRHRLKPDESDAGDQHQIGLTVQPMQMRDRVAEQLIGIRDPFAEQAGRADIRVGQSYAISMTVATGVAFRSAVAVF